MNPLHPTPQHAGLATVALPPLRASFCCRLPSVAFCLRCDSQLPHSHAHLRDYDASGEISLKEFRKAMDILDLHVDKSVVDELFLEFARDSDRKSGAITYNELQRILKAPASPPGGGKAAAAGTAAAGTIAVAKPKDKPPPAEKASDEGARADNTSRDEAGEHNTAAFARGQPFERTHQPTIGQPEGWTQQEHVHQRPLPAADAAASAGSASLEGDRHEEHAAARCATGAMSLRPSSPTRRAPVSCRLGAGSCRGAGAGARAVGGSRGGGRGFIMHGGRVIPRLREVPCLSSGASVSSGVADVREAVREALSERVSEGGVEVRETAAVCVDKEM